MKVNGILYKLFEGVEESCRPGIFRKPLVEKLLHIPEQMGAALLLGECRDKAPVCGVEVGDEDALVELPEVIPDHAGGTVSVNVVERDLAVRKDTEPVALPAGLVGINASCFRKGFLEGFIQGRSLPADLVVEADDGARCDAQAAEILEDSRHVVVGDLDFIPEKSRLGSGIRADECVRDFIRTPAVDDLFADGAPVMGVDKACCLQPAASDVLLDMLRGMAARGEVFVSAMRALVKTDINVFIYAVRSLPEVSRMAERSSSLPGVFRRVLLFISLERSLKRLAVGKSHGELKLVNSLAEIAPLGKHTLRGFADEKHAELLEGAERSMPVSRRGMSVVLLGEAHSSRSPSFTSSTFILVTASMRSL